MQCRRSWNCDSAVTLALSCAAIVLTICYQLLPDPHAVRLQTRLRHHESLFIVHKDRPSYARLVYSSRQPGWDVCTSLFSALALGYPTPYLAGWPRNAGELKTPAERILDIYRYLSDIDPSVSGNDLIIAVDGKPVWFQQRLDTLVSTYLNMTHDHSNTEDSKIVVSVSSLPDGSTSVLSIGSLKNMWAAYSAMLEKLRSMSTSAKLRLELNMNQLLSSDMVETFIIDDQHLLLNAASMSAKANQDDAAAPPFSPLLGSNYHGPSISMPNGRHSSGRKLLGTPGAAAVHAAADFNESLAAWQQLWFYPHVRSMMTAEAVSHVGPFRVASESAERFWWRFPAYGRGLDSVLVEGRESMALEEICHGTSRDAFLDGNEWITVGRKSLGEG